MDIIEKYMTPEELKEARARSEQAIQLLEMASIQLQRSRPFYGTMVANMPVLEATDWLSTCATDGRTFFYSVEFIAGMTDTRRAMVDKRIDALGISHKKRQAIKDQITLWFKPKNAREVVFIFEHEIRHIVNLHIFRAKGLDPTMFNKAADHYINTGLVMEHSVSSAIGKAWFPNGKQTKFSLDDEEFSWLDMCFCDFKYLDWSVEEIYEDMMKSALKPLPKPKPKPPVKGSEGEGDDEGSGTSEENDDNEDGGKSSHDTHLDDSTAAEPNLMDDVLGTDTSQRPERSQEEIENDNAVMRRSIEIATLNAGPAAPKEARNWIDSGQKPKVNYMQILRKTMMSLRKGGSSYSRPHRRSAALTRTLRAGGHITSRQSVVMPGKVKLTTLKVFIGFDVSGSFGDHLLRHVRREVSGMMSQYDEFEVILFCWSTHVGNVVRYNKKNAHEVKDYKINTSFGTDVFCVFDMLDGLNEKIDQLVIFTDGEFASPANHKDWSRKYSKTLWIKMGGRGKWKEPFGKQIEFDKYL